MQMLMAFAGSDALLALELNVNLWLAKKAEEDDEIEICSSEEEDIFGF